MQITRRAFMWTGLAAAAAWLGGLPRSRRLGPGTGLDPALRLVGCLDHRESARTVGRACLAAQAARPSVAQLVEDIAPPGSAMRASLARPGDAELRAALRSAVRRDFALGEVVRVDGWFLSKTEARLCMLAARV